MRRQLSTSFGGGAVGALVPYRLLLRHLIAIYINAGESCGVDDLMST